MRVASRVTSEHGLACSALGVRPPSPDLALSNVLCVHTCRHISIYTCMTRIPRNAASAARIHADSREAEEGGGAFVAEIPRATFALVLLHPVNSSLLSDDSMMFTMAERRTLRNGDDRRGREFRRNGRSSGSLLELHLRGQVSLRAAMPPRADRLFCLPPPGGIIISAIRGSCVRAFRSGRRQLSAIIYGAFSDLAGRQARRLGPETSLNRTIAIQPLGNRPPCRRDTVTLPQGSPQ